MQVKITKIIQEVVEMPDEMFELSLEKPSLYESKYHLKDEYDNYLEDNNITLIEDMYGSTIAEY